MSSLLRRYSGDRVGSHYSKGPPRCSTCQQLGQHVERFAEDGREGLVLTAGRGGPL
jgi:hypothetical protein